MGIHVPGGDVLNSQIAIISPAEIMECVSVLEFMGIFIADLGGKELEETVSGAAFLAGSWSKSPSNLSLRDARSSKCGEVRLFLGFFEGIEAWAATGELLEGMAEVAEAGVADFESDLGDIEFSGGEEFSSFLNPDLAEVLRDSHAHFLGEGAAEVIMAAADHFAEFFERRGIGESGFEDGLDLLDPFLGQTLLADTEKRLVFLRIFKKQFGYDLNCLAAVPEFLGWGEDRRCLQVIEELLVSGG